MEDSLDLRSTLSKHKLNGTSVVESGGDEGASDAGTIIPSMVERSAGRDWLAGRTAHNLVVRRFDFDDDLANSRVYRRNRKNDSNSSFATSAHYVHSWSIFSGLSLADISVISVISLPLNSEDIRKIKDWDLQVSAHDIFARLEPNDPGGALDIDMLSARATQSSLLQATQNEEKAEKKSIISKTSSQSAGSHRSERERWSTLSGRRVSTGSGTSGSLIYREIPEWHKGIDHVDYQQSVKALSDDYEVLRKELPIDREYVRGGNRLCNTCRQHFETFIWSGSAWTPTCKSCYTG